MSNLDFFNFNAKQWLGDDAVLLMDWDVRAMHLHLMCIAWQQDQPGILLNDDQILRRWLQNPNLDDWIDRIKPQILRAWKQQDKYLIQEGLVRESERLSSNSVKRRAAANARWGKKETQSDSADTLHPVLIENITQPEAFSENPHLPGFSLNLLLKDNSIFLEKATQDERFNIWTVGVQLIKDETFTETKARQFLGKMIQEFGEKKVAESIAQLSIKRLAPAEAKSYLNGMLKSEQKRMKNRSKVAL